MTWLEELHDDFAVLGEHHADPEAIGWAQALRREHGPDGAVEAVLGASSVPPAVRQMALEELAL